LQDETELVYGPDEFFLPSYLLILDFKKRDQFRLKSQIQ